jgi:hypothetical protein
MRILIKLIGIILFMTLMSSCTRQFTYHSQPMVPVQPYRAEPEAPAPLPETDTTEGTKTPATEEKTEAAPTTSGVIPVGTTTEMKQQIIPAKKPIPSPTTKTETQSEGVSATPDLN